MSILELISSVLTVFFAGAAAHRKTWAWPVGIAGTLIAIPPYLQQMLTAEAVLQAIYAVLGIWGWWTWARAEKSAVSKAELDPRWMSGFDRFRVFVVFSVLWAGALLIFGSSSSMPWVDSFVLAGGLLATGLEARRVLETWPTWFIINAVSASVAVTRELYYFGVLYAILTGISVYSYLKWSTASGLTTDGKN